MDISAQCRGNCRRREQEFDQRGVTRDQAADRTEGAQRVRKRPAGMRYRRRQFGEAEDERHVQHRDDQRGEQKPDGARSAPAIVPAEVFARDHEPYRQTPQVPRVDLGTQLRHADFTRTYLASITSGSHVTIGGNIVISAIASTSSAKNGSDAYAT